LVVFLVDVVKILKAAYKKRLMFMRRFKILFVT